MSPIRTCSFSYSIYYSLKIRSFVRAGVGGSREVTNGRDGIEKRARWQYEDLREGVCVRVYVRVRVRICV